MNIRIYGVTEKELAASVQLAGQMNLCLACGERPYLVVTDEDFRKVIALEAYHPEAGSIMGMKVVVDDVPYSRIEAR